MNLLKTIIKSIQGYNTKTLDLSEKMAERDLENHLRKLITKHKYLVVIDDMWQREAWKSLKRAFSDSNNASRVIITTRKVGVAERADNRGFVHELCFLRQEESWELFCRKLVDVRAMIPAMLQRFLSATLKRYFLYFGIFPEDQVVEANNIIRMWMAEGFTIPRGEERMENVAEGLLNELIRRSLVQVAKTFWKKVTENVGFMIYSVILRYKRHPT
uniref:Uncharacterized protein n=1 Tax=Solanum lycopersicum TaxID=4081 RepID=K4BP66_SOLLC